MAATNLPQTLRAEFYRDLARFARAGFGLDKALAAIADQHGADPRVCRVARAAGGHLAAGRTIADSLRLADFRMSALEFAMIDAAERGGVLETGFRHLADHFRLEHEARRRIRRALIYPLALLHLALAVGIGVTALLRSVLPGASEGVFADSIRSGLSWVGAGYVLALLAIVAGRRLAAAAATSAPADRLMRRLPLFGPARTAQALSRFCEVFRIQLLAGQRMSQAWESAARAARSGALRKAATAQAVRMADGESLNVVLGDNRGPFPPDFARALASADLSGQLDEEVARWAGYYRDRAAENMELLARWSPKLFYWLVLILAAWMTIRVALGYRDLLEGILDWGNRF